MATSVICNNQDTFNTSFREAVKAYDKHEKPKNWILIVSVLIYLVFIIWAVILVAKMSPSDDKNKHYVLAILFSPAYIISYYVNDMQT